MDKLQSFYEQYSLLKDKLKENFNDFSADLLQYGITEKYKCRHGGQKTIFRGTKNGDASLFGGHLGD